ncbi:MAG: hypothetical protein JNK75_03935 [Betaproteobacteria bacterium]|nr:hypothetical protein [Betaproteobacteria bacterium]
MLARAINRVLGDYPEALRRLAGHAGKRSRLSCGLIHLEVRLAADGRVEPVGAGATGDPDMTFSIAPAVLPRLAIDRTAALREARFTGDGELAQLIAELARELEWDLGEDLSRLIGDIAAQRVTHDARQLHAWQREARSRLHDNLAEYLTEERQAFITRDDLESLARANEDLRDACARLEARLQLLEHRP